ncbi:MAG: hypothetical protein AAGA12_02305 [Pseudomonadota bacterium]
MLRGDHKLTLHIRLFGAFSLGWVAGEEIRVSSAKQRALLAMLATAPEGKRTRAWLQDALWSRSGPSHGRASLRRAIADLRMLFGEGFDAIFDVNNSDITLRPDFVCVLGSASEGAFLEGIDIAEEGFECWLREQRQRPDVTLAGGTVAQPLLQQEATKVVLAPEEKLRPTVAVLSLVAPPGEASLQPIGDMLSEEVSRLLSRSDLLNVISHLSCRNIDPRSVDIAEIRNLIAADYVAWGRFRHEGDTIRIQMDLVDSETGRIEATQDIRGSQRGFLAGDEELVLSIGEELSRGIVAKSAKAARLKQVGDLESHTLLISAVSLMHRQSRASFATARTYLQELIERFPGNSVLQSWMAKWHVLCVVQGWSEDTTADGKIASDLSARALDLASDCSFSMAIDGFVNNNLLRRVDTAMDRYEEAVENDPNCALAWLLKGALHAFMDDGEKAVQYTSRARRLSPLDPHRYFFDTLSAAASLSNGEYEDALFFADRSLSLNARHTSTIRARTVALQRLGRFDEARASAQDLLRKEPGLTVKNYLTKHPAAHFKTGKAWADALAAAGIPNS